MFLRFIHVGECVNNFNVSSIRLNEYIRVCLPILLLKATRTVASVNSYGERLPFLYKSFANVFLFVLGKYLRGEVLYVLVIVLHQMYVLQMIFLICGLLFILFFDEHVSNFGEV